MASPVTVSRTTAPTASGSRRTGHRTTRPGVTGRRSSAPGGRSPQDFLDSVEPVLGAADTATLRADLAGLLADAQPADGRAARSHRTRRAIIDAMRALNAAGDLRPTAPQVAERAGVSLRTVWQHFADMETLMIEAARRDLEILLQLIKPIKADQPLADRTELFVSQRARVLEQMTPSWRAGRTFEPFSPQLQRAKAQVVRLARAELESVFAPELGQLAADRRAQLARALHAISLWAFWESLRTELGLTRQQARQTVTGMFTTLLSQAGFGDSPAPAPG
jgi:TetR/AcrR family transcriptional regulator of autoinduction and epiphytic fitness